MFNLIVILSFSIVFPVVAGWIRYRRLTGDYRLFVWLMSLALVNEMLSLMGIFVYGNAYINYNLYTLICGIMSCYLLARWQLSFNRKLLLYCSLILSCAWVAEWLWLKTMQRYFSYTVIFSSYLIAFLCVFILGERLVRVGYRVRRDPVILLSAGMIFSFLCAAVGELLWVYGVGNNPSFSAKVQLVVCSVLSFSNLLYFIAIIWAPPSIRYLLQSSS